MSQRVFSFVVVLLLFFNGEIFSQKITNGVTINAPFQGDYHRSVSYSGYNPFLEQKKPADSWKRNLSYNLLQPVSLNFYTQSLPFFCRQELKLEKATSIPFKLRLGSLDYVNYLEQKPNAVRPR